MTYNALDSGKLLCPLFTEDISEIMISFRHTSERIDGHAGRGFSRACMEIGIWITRFYMIEYQVVWEWKACAPMMEMCGVTGDGSGV